MAIESLRDISRASTSAFSVGGGGGAGYYEGPAAPNPAEFPLWFNTTDGVFLVYADSTWVEPGANFIPLGGTVGQVPIKQSAADFDMAWGAPTVAWGDVSGKPSTFAPSAHSHAISDVTNLQTELDAKATTASPTFTGTVTLPDDQAVNGVTLTVAGGTTNFLRADGTYATPPAGGGGASPILSWMI